MIKNWPLQIVSKSDVFSLNHSSEKKMLKKKNIFALNWLRDWYNFSWTIAVQTKAKPKQNVRLHLTPNWKWLLRHTCLYCWRNSALGSLMFGSSQKVMQKLNEDNKNKNQLCHNAPGSLHYLEIVAPRIMRKRLLKQRIYFSLCQRQVRINGRILSENRRMEITAKNMRLLSTNSWLWIFVFKMNFEQELENCKKCPYK